ncbi:MAG: fasciclin domain-containing protein [Burkholderiaceae bacterium]
MKQLLSIFVASLMVLAINAKASTQNLLEAATASGQFTTFIKAVDAAGLTEALSKQGPYTLFAPTDEAFEKLPEQELNALMQDRRTLQILIAYHVLPGKQMKSELKDGPVKTVQGLDLTISTKGDTRVENAKIVKADIAASNGVVHSIDTVMLPK